MTPLSLGPRESKVIHCSWVRTPKLPWCLDRWTLEPLRQKQCGCRDIHFFKALVCLETSLWFFSSSHPLQGNTDSDSPASKWDFTVTGQWNGINYISLFFLNFKINPAMNHLSDSTLYLLSHNMLYLFNRSFEWKLCRDQNDSTFTDWQWLLVPKTL